MYIKKQYELHYSVKGDPLCNKSEPSAEIDMPSGGNKKMMMSIDSIILTELSIFNFPLCVCMCVLPL